MTLQHRVTTRFACLTYHHIGDGASQYTISEATLCSQLEFLEVDGYVVEGLQPLKHRLDLAHDLPPRYLVMTVDDGHISSMRAAECLHNHGFTATFFVTRDRSLTKCDFMRPPQLRELRQLGFSLGTHGTSHRKLTRISSQECHKELAESKSWLEDVLGEQVPFTAAPGGFVNENVMRLAAEAGYSMVATCSESMNMPLWPLKMLQTVDRVSVRRHFSDAEFRSIVRGDPWFYLRRQLRSAALWLPKQLLAA